jgi:hypothetical protein
MLVLGSNGTSGSYQISNSVRLRRSATAYLNRTFSSSTNRKTWTFACWFKRGDLVAGGGDFPLFSAQAATYYDSLRFNNDGTLHVYYDGGFGASTAISGSPVFRDTSAWYHIVVSQDTTQATEANRLKIWINGVQQTLTGIPAQNYQSGFNNSVAHHIGKQYSQSEYFDGFVAETYLIDGQALTSTSFGAFDTVTGVWNPIQYAGTYGTNGFYLKFNDTSNFGKDSSGNSNTWTNNNISNTAGATYDSMVDTPTNYGTDSGVGGEVRGNYATWNPLDSWGTVMTDGNLSFYDGGSNAYFSMPCFGKNYFEVACNSLAGGGQFGFCLNHKIATAGAAYGQAGYYGVNYASGAVSYWVNSVNDGLNHGTISSSTLKFAVDSSSGKVWIGSGSTWFSGDPVAGTSPAFTLPVTNGDVIWPIGTSSSGSYILTMNAGQRPFLNTAPSGYKAMCTQNMSTPTISNGSNYMAASIWSGSGGSQTINNTVNGISFQPDMVWIKSRSTATDHQVFDVVRGGSPPKRLLTNSTTAEYSTADGYVGATSTGISLDGSGGGGGDCNVSGRTYIGWQWKASGSTVSNTAGSITSTVSANTTAGFSVVTWAGTSSAATVGHGLGVAPSMVIVKNRSTTTNWCVWHVKLPTPTTDFINLDTTSGYSSNSTVFGAAPTSSVFSVGSYVGTNQNNLVAYCFAPIAGYSAFGSYTGNGSSDGPFVYCGFRPRFVMIKRSDAANHWIMYDTVRDAYNVGERWLRANTVDLEATGIYWDSLSNGFKLRSTDPAVNTSGGTYIYAAFAENPFQISRAR